MSRVFLLDEYVDVQEGEKWYVGRVIDKDSEGYTIRKDGSTSHEDIVIPPTSTRIAPFRRYTKGYEGPLDPIRDDPNLDFSKINDVAKLIEAFSQKPYSYFAAAEINSRLRGRVFLFINNLFLKKNIGSGQIHEIVNFLNKYLDFVVVYFKKGFVELYDKFLEGDIDSESIVNKPSVAYAHFIYEAMESLIHIFGETTYWNSSIFEQKKFTTKVYEGLKANLDFKDPQITLDPKEQKKAWNSGRIAWESDNIQEEEEEEFKMSLKTILSDILINRFAALDGFEHLISIIHQGSESSPEKRNGSMEIENNKKPVQAHCPFKIVQEVIYFFKLIAGKLQDEYKTKLVSKLVEKTFRWLRVNMNTENKDLEIEVIQKLLNKVQSLVESLGVDGFKQSFYKRRETRELEIFLELLDSPKLEKKFKGLEGIKKYITRIEASLVHEDDAWNFDKEKELHYFDHGVFLKWLLDNQVIELIYKKYQHIELIKRSIEILRFIVKNCKTFPKNLINIIWESCEKSNEEALKVIYNNILELPSYLDIEAAAAFFEKFSKVNAQDYDEEFVDFLCKFTEKCLELYYVENKNGLGKIKEDIEEQYYSLAFGIPQMFDLAMDESPLSPALSNKVLNYILNFMNRFPIIRTFTTLAKRCVENIKTNISVCQSLIILREFLTWIQNSAVLRPLCTGFYEKYICKDNIIHLINSYEAHWSRTREKLLALKKVDKFDTSDEKYLHTRFIGKYSNYDNIKERLYGLKMYIIHPFQDNSLSYEQFKFLWKICVIKCNFAVETQLFLEIISKRYQVDEDRVLTLVKSTDIKKIFVELICNSKYFNMQKLTMEKFKCFEFFFIYVNLHEKKLALKPEEADPDGNLTSNSIIVLNTELTGLEILWNYLAECSDKGYVDEFCNLLVNIFTSLGPELQSTSQKIHQGVINKLMKSLETSLQAGNFQAIQVYIKFMSNFLDKVENRINEKNFETFDLSDPNVSRGKLQLKVKFHPYEVVRLCEFHGNDKLGKVKIGLAQVFDIDINDFDMNIDESMITGDDLNAKLKNYYLNGAVTIYKRYIDSEATSSAHLIVQKKAYIEKFFSLFAAFAPEKLKAIWDFFQKLPLQADIMREFSERTDFTTLLQDSDSISNNNLHRLYYYLSIIKELALVDPYYWKMPNVSMKQTKSDWASNFVKNNGVQSLINLITKTDFKTVPNFLSIKTLTLLYQMLRFFFLSYEHTKTYWNDQLFTKTLDILLYFTRYIATDMSMVDSDKDIIKDYEQLFTTISPMLQSVVRNQKNFCKTFLLYPYLKELCYEIFINLSNEEFPSSSDIQDSFHIFLNVVLENVQTLPEKKCSSKLFQILLEQITFEAIESTKPAFKTLKVTAGLLKSYDLKKQFDCSIDIFQLMVKIVGYIVGFHPSRNKHKEPKLEACFFIIYRYLEHNEEKLEHFGQEEGLIEEILANGIFKVPTQNKKEKPKYQLKTLITIAFQTLTLLAKDERNLKSIIKFLLPMHMTNTWRGQKYASWALSSNNKKKTVNFAGLKNLGCTCYMNSTLQQLFMIPSFNKALFSLEDPTFNKDEVDDNMLFQLKRLFYGLNNIEKEFFSPKKFCLAFKDIEGNPTNFREQKDAFEFLSLLLERLEDRVKKTKHQDFIKNLFEGKFSSDVKCTSCPHFYEREEPFLGVNLIVKHTKNIQESLENFVASQSLTGDNAYECEKCKKKVEASRRVSFKNLPNYLIFGLSRFEYDFSRGVRIKINEYFEFSQELDMEPYTQQGLNDRENAQQKTGKQVPDLHKTTSNGDIHSDTKYSLKGVVVHVGVADSGHYYSLIKDKQIDKKSSPAWLEFNDTRVCEFDINQLSKVAFGDSPGSTPLQSAYILVYEKKQLVEEQEDIRRKVVKSKGSGSYVPDEKAMELEELEKETNYKDDEIAYIHDFQNEILKKNQKLFYIEKLFSPEYTQFLQSLIKSCSDKFREDATSSQNDSAIVINDNMLRELFKFIWNAYVSTILRSSDFNLQQSVFEWLYYQMDRDEKLPRYIIQYFSNENFFTEMILQCPKKVSRKFVMGLGQGAFRKIFRIDKNNESFFRTNGKGHSLSLTANFMCLVLNMLPKTKYYLRSIETYFDFFYSLAQIDTEIIKFILSHQGVGRLFHYFLNSHSMMETIDDPFTTPIIYTEYTIPLEYDPDFLNDPRKDKKEDFENPNLTNLSKFFSLLWLVMRYSYIPKRESYKKFLYYKSGINHELTGDETKLLELDSFKIYKLFSYLNLDDKKIRIAICKIIAFLSFGSMTDTSASLEYLDNALKQDTSDKTLEDCYQLIRVLSKVNDNFQQERNKALMENIISAAVKKAGNMFELNVFARTIRKLSSSSRALESAMKDNPDLLMKIIRTLREAINIELEKSSDKPTNHTVREQIKKLLGQHKDYFGDLKLGKKPETAADLDPASDLDDVPDTKFTRGQNVEYYDDVSKKYVKGIVDNVYEDLIKVKVVTGDGINHRWFDDPSHLHLVVDKTD